MVRTIASTARAVKHRIAGNGRPAEPREWERPAALTLDARPVGSDSPAFSDRIRAVAAMGDLALSHRESIERERRLPDEILTAMDAAAFSTMLVPERFGGDALQLIDGVRVVEALARLDGSIGWNAWVIVGHGRTAEHMTAEAAHLVFEHGRRTIAGSLTPTGRAVRAPGGYRLSGRWAFGSATNMSDHIQAGAFAHADGAPIRRSDGSELHLGLVVPVAMCSFVDTWHTTGLRGTASNDVVIEDVFVPDAMTFDERRMWTALGADEDVEFGRPYDEFAAPLIAAVAVGIAADALDSFVQLCVAKNARPNPDWSSRLPLVHDTVGRARARVESARSHLHALVHGIDALAPASPVVGVHARAVAANVVQDCITAVDVLYEAGGGSSIYSSNRLERCFRDVHMVSHHMLVAQRTFVDLGRLEIDLVR